MKKITFFCEGVEDNDNSLDWQLFRILLRPLSRTLKSLHFTNGEEDGDNDLDILGMRSKSYYTRYIEGFKNKSKLNDVDDTIIAAFRDRDFDIEVKQTELHNLQILTKPNANPVLYCGERTTIENYLLDYQTFTDYVQNHLSSKKPDINSIQDTKRLFRSAAQEIAAHQATRHALGAVARLGIPQLYSNIKDGEKRLSSGQLPKEKSKDFCKNAGIAIIEAYGGKAQNLTRDKFTAYFDDYFSKFISTDFINDDTFLIWFNGKDLAAAIREKHENFDFKGYYRFALTQVEKGNLDFPNDLLTLRQHLETLQQQ